MKRVYKFGHTQKGLRKNLKEYQELALRYIWEKEEGATSGETWKYVNEILSRSGKSISRASVIFFLDDMVDEGVLGYTPTTGKGGRFRIYTTKMNESEYRKYMLRTIINSMMRDFPEETIEVLQEAIKAVKG